MVYVVIILFATNTISGYLHTNYDVFVNIYITMLIAPLIMLMIVEVRRNIYYDKLSIYIILFFVFVIISGVILSSYNPAIFILFALVLYTVAGSVWSKESDLIFNSFFEYLAVILITALLILSLVTEYDRFSGFSVSATTLSIYLLIIYVVLVVDKPKIYALLFGLPVVYLLLISQTRSALVLFLVIVLLSMGYGERKHMKKLFIVTVLLLSFVYPIYGALSALTDSGIMLRDGDLQDGSFITRYWLTMYIFEDYLQSNIFHILFGLGAEQSRSLVMDYYGYDVHVHNDFLRLLYDFGVIGSMIYIFILYKIAIKNRLTYILIIIYLFSFFHNMIYDVYQLCILLIFAQQRSRHW
ncbi:MAG: hypothetical protein EA412_10880 [Chitinophagaceae bacterium]|nr:MAG: hypothetical protein EA412_10880 [Chitinophagaceae bacterium]